MKTARWLIGALACALVVSSVARTSRADDYPDEVNLKSGGSVRGTVVSVEPNSEVKIIEAGSGSVRVFPWADVSGVAKGKYVSAPTQPPTVTPIPAPSGTIIVAPPYSPPTAFGWEPVVPPLQLKTRLHVTSPEPTDIILPPTYVSLGNGQVAEGDRVCAAPCDREISYEPGSSFRVRGDFPGTPSFTLDGMGTNAELVVDPGSRGVHAGGKLLLGLGVTGMITGAVFIPVAIADSAPSDTDPFGSRTPNKGFLEAGGIALGAGVVSMVTGIVMMATSHTRYSLHPLAGLATTQAASTPRVWAGATTVATSATAGEANDAAGQYDRDPGTSVVGLKAAF
jgi:hypothetical protein